MIFCDLPVKEFELCHCVPVLQHDVLTASKGSTDASPDIEFP